MLVSQSLLLTTVVRFTFQGGVERLQILGSMLVWLHGSGVDFGLGVVADSNNTGAVIQYKDTRESAHSLVE